ncbi:L-ascorbate peroxidase 1, cytosolic isoform X2 [Sesamum indicum]|uniref:L-ascorbate peroxidase 1, cytosolic isoform X2 n=1 Tax=Sesamum indicum TaxID=4182 RepID=A0A8M8UZM0_SESIN|nr:L-ascorbate peroxidase 1, cytosolic isoform X2 [Sesamum indicum]
MSSKTAGPFGTTRLKAEQGHTANNGIEIAVRLLEPIKSSSPCFLMLTSISWLVLLLLKLLEDLKFHFTLEGRTEPPTEGRLPNATKGCDHLSDVFIKQMGLSKQDNVVLSGGHTLFCSCYYFLVSSTPLPGNGYFHIPATK